MLLSNGGEVSVERAWGSRTEDGKETGVGEDSQIEVTREPVPKRQGFGITEVPTPSPWVTRPSRESDLPESATEHLRVKFSWSELISHGPGSSSRDTPPTLHRSRATVLGCPHTRR